MFTHRWLLWFKPLFAGSNEVDQLAKIHNILGTPNNRIIAKFKTHKSINCEYFPKQCGTGLSPLLINLTCDGQNVLKLMVTYDPDVRSNIKRLLEHRYFACYRKPEDRFRHKRSSSVEPRPAKLGDFRNPSNASIKLYNKNSSAKYNTTIDRASQNDVLTFKENNTSSKNLCKFNVQDDYKKVTKQPSDLNNNIMKVLPGYQKQTPYLIKKNFNYKKPPYMFRKTTSNLSDITEKTKEPKIIQQQSKSFVLPRMATKRLEPIPEINTKDKLLPKRPRILALDSSFKLIVNTKK